MADILPRLNVLKSNLAQSRSSRTSISVVNSFWKVAQSTTVRPSCSVQRFNTIWQQGYELCLVYCGKIFFTRFQDEWFWLLLWLYPVYEFVIRTVCWTVLHPTWLRTYADSLMHAERVAPWTVKQSSVVRPSGRRLGDLHWILQAAISFRQIIHTSYAEILHAIIRQLPRQE